MIVVKTRRPEIPYKKLPEGINLSFKNFIRLHSDAQFLAQDKRYQSALPLLILAKEELAKAILLYQNYKKSESMKNKRLENTFESHKFRLREFTKFMFSEGSGMDEKEVERVLTFEYYFADRDHRESSIYVNWTKEGWIEPSKFFFTHDLSLQRIFTEKRFKFIQDEILSVLDVLMRDYDFKSICGIN